METSAPKRRKTSPTEGIPVRGSNANSQPASSTQQQQQHGAAASRPRRTIEKPSPRPLPPPPPPEEDEEEAMMDPFRGRVLRRSPPRGAGAGVLPRPPPPEEPELPPTPTEKGLSDPSSIHTSPLGIHNTPSKRARRSKSLAEKLKSSPLKQPPLRPPPDHNNNNNNTTEGKEEGPTKKKASASGISQPVIAQSRPRRQEEIAKHVTVSPSPSKKTLEAFHNDDDDEEAMIAEQLSHPHPARKIPVPDPFAEKKAIRDSLLAEVAQLENDIEFASRENARLHRYHQQAGSKGRRDDWTAEDRDKILDLLRRTILPQAPPESEPQSKKEEEPGSELLLAALNPISFLPFNKADQPIPPLPSNTLRAATATEREETTPVASHYPIPMTADEELPYLQVFTPLTFTSTVSILPQPRGGPEDPDATTATTMSMMNSSSTKPTMQKHVISVASSPPGLFAARLEMTVNTKTLSVAELSVPQLDPAAAAELRPFIERISKGGRGSSGSGGSGSSSNTSALARNVSVVAWAMGEWTRLATRRARFWCAVERELASRPQGIARCVRQMRKRGNNKRRRVGGGGGTDEDEEDEDEDELEDGRDGKKGRSKSSRADLMRYMGKSSFDLDLSLPGAGEGEEEPPPSVRIQWKIELDWTGEARSKMGLFVAAPAKWHGNGKGRKSLAGIPVMFDQLISKNVNPMVAVKTVVALLAGDGGSS